MRSNDNTDVVSVIIPSFNRAYLLPQAIQSVLDQTYRNFEIIVVDDGSTDNTREITQAFGNQVRYLYQSNKGASAARNHGIREARGEFIAFLDSDDWFMPQKLEKQVKFLRHNSRVSMVYSNYMISNEYNESSWEVEVVQFNGYVFQELLWLCMTGPLTTPTVMVRRSVFKKVDPFDESMHLAEDIDLWCRIARHFELGCIPEPLSRIRFHPGNTSGDTDPLLNLAVWLRIINKACKGQNSLPWTFKRQLYAKVYYVTYVALKLKQKPDLAKRYLLRALLSWPIATTYRQVI